MIMKQEFRKIPSLDFRYEVSKDGVVRNAKSKKIKKQQITIHGYYRTNYSVNKTNPHYTGKSYGWDRPVHQLVMECWGPQQPSPNHIIDHIDRNKLNNNITNLRWVTHSENFYNQDMEILHKHAVDGQLNSKNKIRHPVTLIDKKTGEAKDFNSCYQGALWILSQGRLETKHAEGVARRMKLQHYVGGYKVIIKMPND